MVVGPGQRAALDGEGNVVIRDEQLSAATDDSAAARVLQEA